MEGIQVLKLKNVELQENGIIRLAGVILARINKDIWTIDYDENDKMTINSKYIKQSSGKLVDDNIDQPLERISEKTKKTGDPTNGCNCDYCKGYRFSQEVEPLQNGEREELKKIRDIIERDSECEYGVNDEDVAEVMEIIKDLLSQSKKEEILTDAEKEVTVEALYSWRNHVRRMLSEHHGKSVLRNRYYEDIESAYEKLESLTNQKKEDEKNKT